jgi:hypothetical protein
MTATAVAITGVSFDAQNEAGAGGEHSLLTVRFHVAQRGYAHVAGIVVSTNGWATRSEVTGRWDHNEGDTEVWGCKLPGQRHGGAVRLRLLVRRLRRHRQRAKDLEHQSRKPILGDRTLVAGVRGSTPSAMTDLPAGLWPRSLWYWAEQKRC